MLGKVLQGKLLTRQFLKGLGITQEDHCVLCIQDTETVDHLFFSCSFSAYLWQLCKLKLGINPSISNLVDEASKIKFKVRRKCNTSTLARLVLSALVWHIRTERNNMTFKQEWDPGLERTLQGCSDSNATRCLEVLNTGTLNSVLTNWGITR